MWHECSRVGRHSSSGAQESLGRLAAEHADALAVAYDELSAQLAAAQAQAEKAEAAAADQLQSLREEAAAEQQALSARVAALEHERAGRWETLMTPTRCLRFVQAGSTRL